MTHRYTIETAFVPFLVGLAFAGAAMGASRFISLSPHPLALRPVAFPEEVRLEVPLSATAAVIYDPRTGKVLFAKNEEMQLPLASLTKVMTAAAVLSTSDPKEPVRISAEALRYYGDSGLRPGEVWSLGNLIKLGPVASSNDAIAAAALAAGEEGIIALMNREAERLGLSQTYFLEPTGLDLTSETAGAYGSALDMAVLFSSFLKQYPEALEVTARSEVHLAGGFDAKSTSVPIHDVPGLIGAKTGYTDLAGGNLVAAFDADIGRPLIAAVLGSSEEGRFEDMRLLIKAARSSVAAAAQAAYF